MSPKYERHLLQNIQEFSEYLAILRKEKVKSYLEIGSKNGGSLFRVAMKLDKGSKIVSVDLPHGDHSFKNTLPNLEDCIKRLKNEGYDAHLIVGDSTAPETIEKTRALGPFDVVFIDGNHTRPYIQKDWENYGPMSRIVAFHDIGYHRDTRDTKKLPIDAPEFWKDLKDSYRHHEIKHELWRKTPEGGNCCDNGIGVLWRN